MRQLVERACSLMTEAHVRAFDDTGYSIVKVPVGGLGVGAPYAAVYAVHFKREDDGRIYASCGEHQIQVERLNPNNP